MMINTRVWCESWWNLARGSSHNTHESH